MDKDAGPAATLDRLLAWLRWRVEWFELNAAFECFHAFAAAQYYTYLLIGWGLRVIWSFCIIFANAVQYARACSDKLEKIFKPAPPSRCSLCGVLSQYCNSNFRYRQVESSAIRLIRVDANAIGHQFETATFPLRTAPSYSALSYRWTEAEASYRITLDKQSFYVRQNLFNYLRTVKAEAQDGWKYIDAISINQHDFAERSDQVSLMKEIYQRAAEVVIWLRRPRMLTSKNQPPEENDNSWRALLTEHLGEEDGVLHNEPGSKTMSPKRHMKLLEWFLFCSDDYWTRLWPVQEILLATNLVLKSEGVTLDWSDFVALLRELTPHAPSTGLLWGRPIHKLFGDKAGPRQIEAQSMFMMWELITRRTKAIESKLDSLQSHAALHENLVIYGGQRCADPRDKVFGLLGISQSYIRADYSMPLAEVYLRALLEGVVAIMETHDAEDTTDGALVTYIKLRTFCYNLQYSMGINGITASSYLVSMDMLNRLITPGWIYYDFTWLGGSEDDLFDRILKPMVQGQETWNTWFRLLWMYYFVYKLYTDTCRLHLVDRHPWLSKLLSAPGNFKAPAAFLFDIVLTLCVVLVQVRTYVHYADESRLSFPAGPEDSRTYKEWSDLVTTVVKDMSESGAVPKAYTDYRQMEIFKYIDKPEQTSSETELIDLE